MAVLSKEAILGADDLPKKTVFVKEWGGSVIVRSMTGGERDQYEQSIFDSRKGDAKANMDNIRARLVAFCCVDENGALIFSESDVAKLGKKSAKALDKVFAVARELNGMTAEDVDELAGNSESGQSDDSISS